MKRTLVASMLALTFAGSTYLLSEKTWAAEPANDYPQSLKLAIATAISPRSPPVQWNIKASGGSRPILWGTTSLPDGAVIQVSLKKPWLPDARERLSIGMAACADNDCIPPGVDGQLSARIIVANGKFQTGPFTFFNGRALAPGIYPYEILLETNNWANPTDLFHKVAFGQIEVR